VPTAVLFDLDNTLLGNSMDTFVPAYFQALTQYLAAELPPQKLIAALMHGTAAMDANSGDGQTNKEVFDAVFYTELDVERSVLEPRLQQFYATEFPKLQPLTYPLPEARPLISWALDCGLQVVIATNPLFPRVAIEHRLFWAGIPMTEFEYSLVTTYENMHATKASLEYYREILSKLGLGPQDCLMVGDDFMRDMGPASAAGIPVFWIAPPQATVPDAKVQLVGRGDLSAVWDWLAAPTLCHTRYPEYEPRHSTMTGHSRQSVAPVDRTEPTAM